MKKSYLKVFCLTLAITCMPVPVFADTGTTKSCMDVCMNDLEDLRADIKYYVHKTLNGVVMHRLWNSTQGKYEGLWTICDCK